MYSLISGWQPAPYETPTNTAMFAIGDIHGQADLLSALHTVLKRELRALTGLRNYLIYLGDYIDRGADSIGVLSMVEHDMSREQAEIVHLVGNHDQFLIEFLGFDDIDNEFVSCWLNNGGMQTWESLEIDAYRLYMKDAKALQSAMAEKIGAQTRAFLDRLVPSYRLGHYVFVHAGVDPKVPIESNEFADLLLMREPFLSCMNWPHDCCVVHGHTIGVPTILPHRIGVDTGAFVSGVLTAAQIMNNQVRFISVVKEVENKIRTRLFGEFFDAGYSQRKLF